MGVLLARAEHIQQLNWVTPDTKFQLCPEGTGESWESSEQSRAQSELWLGHLTGRWVGGTEARVPSEVITRLPSHRALPGCVDGGLGGLSVLRRQLGPHLPEPNPMSLEAAR